MPPRIPNAPSPEGADENLETASTEDIKAELDSPDMLRAKIKALEEALAKSDAAKSIAEEQNERLQAEAQTSLYTAANVNERFAGKSEDGKHDMWWYRIDLAPCGGIYVQINGVQYVHGETYKFSTDVLRSVKEIAARTWGHEAQIHGENENPYKQAQNRVLGGSRAPAWAYQR
jgi:hypothetical protein